jgi:hypothetical protein
MFGWHRAYEASGLGLAWEKPAYQGCRRRGGRMTRKGGSASATGFGRGQALVRR